LSSSLKYADIFPEQLTRTFSLSSNMMLMWDMRRRIHIDRLPDKRIVAEFDFQGIHKRTIWLVLERPEPSVCLTPPGFDTDLLVTADTLALHRVWMGRLTFGEALARRLVQVDGPPSWSAPSPTGSHSTFLPISLLCFSHAPEPGSHPARLTLIHNM
jgi:hypothetical protein